MTKLALNPDKLPNPVGPYSQVVVAEGRKIVFISGQVPADEKGNLVGKGDITAQTKQVLTNIKAALEAAGGSVANIVKMTIFMVDIGGFKEVSRLRREFFGGDYPAATLVEVKRLVSPDWLIEMEAIAVL